MSELTVVDLVARSAASEPDAEAMIVHGVGSLRYGEWWQRARAVARALAAAGVAPGDRIALRFPAAGWCDYAVACLGVWLARAVIVPIGDRLAPAQAEASMLVAEVSMIVGSAAQLSSGIAVATLDELEGGAALDHSAPPRPHDLAQILFTSGTTGRPKGVTASHANLAHGLGRKHRPFAHSRHLVHAFPIGTNAGQTMLRHAVDAAPTVVTLPAFTAARFAALIERYAAGTIFLVPSMAIELLNADVGALPSVLLLGSSAAPLPAPIASRLTTIFPNATIANYYTSTESAPAETVMIFDGARPGSVGRASAGGQVRVATADGETVPVGSVGEVWMRTPVGGRAYLDEPASPVFRDGWVRMGDLGRLDDDGYLYLLDRAADVIKSGAFKVSTPQVEEALYAHPDVVEVAAFGVPHPVLGTVVAAALVVRRPIDEPELRRFLATRLAPQERPAHYLWVDALPHNRGGKVDKRALAETLASKVDA